MDVRLEMAKFDVSHLRQYGTVIISASAVNGIFMLFIRKVSESSVIGGHLKDCWHWIT